MNQELKTLFQAFRPNRYDKLKAQLQGDSEVAWAWHCNIAMALYDTTEEVTHEQANIMAVNVMRRLFDVDTYSDYEKYCKGPANSVDSDSLVE